MQRRPAAQPAAAPAAPDAPSAVTIEFRRIPIDQLHESALNPRRRFHEPALQELAASIRTHGVLTPLLARPTSNGESEAFELAAGHRRFRASRLAELAELPVVVRPMSDVEFLEVLTIENLQREDVHPLEEAQGFADLIKHGGYDVGKIADRIGKSHRYVYDRLRFLQLTDELQQIFFDGEITAGHAVLLARLSSADQARVLKETGALFTIDHGATVGQFPLHDRRKAMSTGELQRWIDHNVRFNPLAEDVPELFPQTDVIVATAREVAEKVIPITSEHYVRPEAKEEGERTYGPMSWKRADGQYESKPCEHAVTGVIVVGHGRGEAFKVCTARKTCTVHWGREIRETAKRAKEREQNGSMPNGVDRHAAERAREEEQRKAGEAKRAEFEKARPAIFDAIVAKMAKQKTGAASPLGRLLIGEVCRGRTAIKGFEPGTSADDLVRYLGGMLLATQARYHNAHDTFPRFAKQFGVDVAAILKGDTTPRFPAKKAAKKTAKKARR